MLLANLLRTLSEEELDKIRKGFRLSERSRMLFERIAETADSPPITKELSKAFRIPKATLYRICSEIVDECVRILAPKEEYSTLKFYCRRYLYRPYITESYREEKRLVGERDKKALERLYAYVFLNRTFPAGDINVGILQEFGNKWYKFKENPKPDDDLFVQMRVILIRVIALSSGKKINATQIARLAHRLLDHITERASTSPNPLVRHEYYQAMWVCTHYEPTDPKIRLGWLERSLEVIRSNSADFDPALEQTIELQIAYDLAMRFNKADKGLEIFQKYYRQRTPDSTGGASFFSQFIKVAFLARKFDLARKVLGEFEMFQIVQTNPSIHINSMITGVMLDLIEGSPDAAVKKLDKAEKANREHFYFGSEIEIRGLETIIALKRNDLTLTDQLVDRNIKWLRSRKILAALTSWSYFYQMIGGIIRYRVTGEQIRPSLREHFMNDFRTEYPEYFIILESEIPSKFK